VQQLTPAAGLREVLPVPHGRHAVSDKDEEGLWDRLMQVWWGYLVIAAFCFGVALLCYWHISSIEERGGGRVN